jgi:hypothetical protein
MIISLFLFEDEFLHIVSISFTALVLNELIMVALEITTWSVPWTHLPADGICMILTRFICQAFVHGHFRNRHSFHLHRQHRFPARVLR